MVGPAVAAGELLAVGAAGGKENSDEGLSSLSRLADELAGVTAGGADCLSGGANALLSLLNWKPELDKLDTAGVGLLLKNPEKGLLGASGSIDPSFELTSAVEEG